MDDSRASRKLPPYYTGLAPFRDWFGVAGLPMLTYHKLGPRPPRARLKGLYVGAKLFERQLRELSDAGYASCSLDDLAAGLKNPDRRVVISFDDGYENVFKYGVEPLQRYGMQSIQYIVADAIGGRNEWDIGAGEAPEPLMTKSQISQWLAAGQTIGSHGLSHACLTALPVSQAREEIFSSKKKLEDLFGLPVKHFCYPYGVSDPVIRDLVAEAGYATACSTDFGLNGVDVPHHALKRITARYQSWGLKTIRQRLFG